MMDMSFDNPNDVKAGLEKVFLHNGPVLVSI